MSGLSVGVCSSLTEESLRKLNTAGIKNILDFILRDPESLAEDSEVSYRDIQNIRRVICAVHGAFAIPGQDALREAIASTSVLSSGFKRLDALLGGGLMTGELIEICGKSGVGKSLLCLCIALDLVLHHEKHVLYVDANGSISSSFIKSAVKRFTSGNEYPTLLSHMEVTYMCTLWDLFNLLENCMKAEARQKYDIVIIDSLPVIMRPVLASSHTSGLGLLNLLGSQLKQLASENHSVVITVNGVTDQDQPMLGRMWSHVPHTRLLLQKGKTEDELTAVILKSTRLNCAHTKLHLFC